MNDKQILSRAAAIQRYLIASPESEDTLERIHRGWFRSRSLEETPQVTQAALDYLLVAGFIEVRVIDNRQQWRRAENSSPIPFSTPASLDLVQERDSPGP